MTVSKGEGGFEMIEDLGGCFHHFSHLLACPQGDGKEILSFSSLADILMEEMEIFWQYFSSLQILSVRNNLFDIIPAF